VLEHQVEHESQWAAICSIAAKIGCTAETLHRWVRQAERDTGLREGISTSERERIKALEREVRELRQANEILRKASAYFAQAELDRAASSHKGVHRRASSALWGRANLQSAADCPIKVLHPCGPPGRPCSAAVPRTA
jgi:transposase-like protein